MPTKLKQKDWVKVKKLDSDESRKRLDLTVSETRKLHEDREERDKKLFERMGLPIEQGQAMITRPLRTTRK